MVDCLAETNACFGLVGAFWIGICGLLRQPKVVQSKGLARPQSKKKSTLFFLLEFFILQTKHVLLLTKVVKPFLVRRGVQANIS